jgi:hypothetical protein
MQNQTTILKIEGMSSLTKFLFKYSVLFLTIIILFGNLLTAVKEESMLKIDQAFSHTDNYSPLRLPMIFTKEKEYIDFLNILSDIEKETQISFMKRTINESYSIRQTVDFQFLPKLEIILYYPHLKTTSVYSPPLTNAQLQTQDILHSIQTQDYEGNFFLRTKNEESYLDFVARLRDRFNNTFQTDYSIDDFADFGNQQHFSLGLDKDVFNLSSYLTIGTLFLFSILFFLVISYTKDIKLLRENGFAAYAILFFLLGKRWSLVLFLSCLCFVGISLNYSTDALFSFLSSAILLILSLWLFSLLIIFTTLNINISLSLKRTRFVQKRYLGIFIFRFLFCFSLILTSSEALQIVYSNFFTNTGYQVPVQLKNEKYQTFYPLAIGKNQVDFIYSDTLDKLVDDVLYRPLNEKGSILVNVSDYLIEENEEFGRGIHINPNYLKKFPILDEIGKEIQIAEKEKARILLIPERFNSSENHTRLKKIKDYYLDKTMQFSNEGNLFIFIQNDQPIYTFMQNQPYIKDYPLLLVHTLANSDYWDRNIIDGSLYPPLKIRTDHLPKDFISRLLIENQLTDNLPFLADYFDTEATQIKRMSGSFVHLVAIAAFTTFSFFTISCLTANFYFDCNRKKLFLLRINGFSFIAAYKEYFIALFLQFFGVLFLLRLLEDLTNNLIVTTFLILMLDLITSFLFISILEQKRTK